MIKKMEKRFAIVAIAVISLVLLFLVIAVQFISSQINVKKADIILNTIAIERKEVIFGIDEKMKVIDADSLSIFSVFVDNNEQANNYHVDGMGIIEDEKAISLTSSVLEANDSNGFIEGYRYLLINEDHISKVYFLDYSFEQESANLLLMASLIVYVIAVIMVWILVKIFMRYMMRPIKESYEKQKQFITDASHELKTPLTVIKTDMQLIEMESASSKWTQSVNKQVERLTILSNDLVTLSSMDEESNQVKFNEVNLSSLVSDVVFGFEPAFIANGKKIKVDLALDIKLKGDYDALEKVMTILMENSLKYSVENSEIIVKLWQKNKEIVLSVENMVSHIKIGKHNEYFERFYRADQSRNSTTGGFGIGLAIAKSTIEQHKGKIEAYSPNEQRIIFTITL